MWSVRLVTIFTRAFVWPNTVELTAANVAGSWTLHYTCTSLAGSRAIPFARQHPSYGDCLEVKKEYYQNCSVLDCVTQCSQSAAHLYEQFLQFQQICFVTLGPLNVVRRGGCLELYYCNMMEWFCWDSSLISTTNWFRPVI